MTPGSPRLPQARHLSLSTLPHSGPGRSTEGRRRGSSSSSEIFPGAGTAEGGRASGGNKQSRMLIICSAATPRCSVFGDQLRTSCECPLWTLARDQEKGTWLVSQGQLGQSPGQACARSSLWTASGLSVELVSPGPEASVSSGLYLTSLTWETISIFPCPKPFHCPGEVFVFNKALAERKALLPTGELTVVDFPRNGQARLDLHPIACCSPPASSQPLPETPAVTPAELLLPLVRKDHVRVCPASCTSRLWSRPCCQKLASRVLLRVTPPALGAFHKESSSKLLAGGPQSPPSPTLGESSVSLSRRPQGAVFPRGLLGGAGLPLLPTAEERCPC